MQAAHRDLILVRPVPAWSRPQLRSAKLQQATRQTAEVGLANLVIVEKLRTVEASSLHIKDASTVEGSRHLNDVDSRSQSIQVDKVKEQQASHAQGVSDTPDGMPIGSVVMDQLGEALQLFFQDAPRCSQLHLTSSTQIHADVLVLQTSTDGSQLPASQTDGTQDSAAPL